MGKINKVLAIILLQTLTSSAVAAIYEREGFTYLNFSGSYDNSMKISSQFETSVDLIGIPLTDISSLVTSYNFSDGVQTLTETNSEIIRFFVETNGGGYIGRYDIALWQSPVTNTPGEVLNGIELSLLPNSGFPVSLINEFGFSEYCDVPGITQCAEFTLNSSFGQYIDGGGVTPVLVPGWDYVSSTPPNSGSQPIAVKVGSFWTLIILVLLIIYYIPHYLQK